MQTDTTPYSQPDYWLTAADSQTDRIAAHNSQVNTVVAHNFQIAELIFQTHNSLVAF